MDADELGLSLRTRRKAAGRTIASVAMDAGLSVPYIANLENGRGNPTLSALHRLANALGTQLSVSLRGDGDGNGDGEKDAEPPPDATVVALMASPRVRSVAGDVATTDSRDVKAVLQGVHEALLALRAVKGGPLTERDLDRLLDAIV